MEPQAGSAGTGAGTGTALSSAEHAASGPSLTTALNWDALEEVFVQCSPRDLLALRGTCRAASELLGRSERVWLAKLRESFGLHLRTLKSLAASQDGLFMRLARQVFEASRTQQLRFQGVYVGGGVDEDAMHYWLDNLFRPDKTPYCSNCSRNADCLALLLDGEVPRDAEFARIRQYMIRRCRYAAALIMNVQVPEHGRDPDDIMHILEDWTDMQLEGFFRDLVGALQAEHALGRLLVFDIPHERLAAEEQKILGVHQWLLDRPQAMKAAMLKPPGSENVMFDSSVVPKLTAGLSGGMRRLAGVVTEVSLSRVGNLTCPVAAGAVVAGCIDHSKVEGWSADEVMALLQRAVADPVCAALNGLQDAAEVAAASEAGLLPPIVSTDQTLAGVWHEFDTSEEGTARQAAAAAAAAGSSAAGQPAAARQHTTHATHTDGAPPASADTAAAGGAGAAGPSCSGPSQASSAGVITWRPLLWFKFHSVEEAVAFLHRNRPLIELHGSQATLRHRGPPPTRRGHVAAPLEPPATPARQQAQAQAVQALAQALAHPVFGQAVQQAQQPPPQQQQQVALPPLPAQAVQHQHQHQQPAAQQQGAPPLLAQPVAVGVPVPAVQPLAGLPAPTAAQGAQLPPVGPPHAGAAAAFAPHAEGAGGGEPGLAAGPAGGAVLPQGPLQAEDDGEESEGGDSEGADMEGDLSDDDDESSGSDDDGGGEQGAWLANWVQDEFGVDLQEQEQDMVVAGEGLPFDQMDEGESSEEEGLDVEAGEHFDLAAVAGGAAGAAGGAAAGQPAGDGAAPLVVQASPAETLLRALSRQNTRARNRLRCPLSRPVGANILLVKLINQENLMEHYGDQHSWPNIDMTFVGLTGKKVSLPAGVVL